MTEMILCKFCTHCNLKEEKCIRNKAYPVYVGEACNLFDNRYEKKQEPCSCNNDRDIYQNKFEDACFMIGFLMGYGKL